VEQHKRLWHALLFLAGTIIYTWSFYIPIVTRGLDPYQGIGLVLLLFGGSGPSTLGVAMAMLTYGKPEKMAYLRRSYDVWSIGPFWWSVILLLAPAIVALSIGLDVALGGTPPSMSMLKTIIINPFTLFPFVFTDSRASRRYVHSHG